MGVQGLWQLLHPAGKPVSPSSLEGKVLAVDVSIWLHQTMKGMRGKDGNPLPNAHLQGLFSRVCKLLFYRIKPIFVFDGGVPALKKQTLAVRRERKETIDKEKGRTSQKILQNLLKSHAVRGLTGETTEGMGVPARPGAEPDMYQLLPLPEVDKGSKDPLDNAAAWEADGDMYDHHRHLINTYQDDFQNLDEIDFESEEFKSLPAEIRHEILTEMKEQRKENALARIAIMPEESQDFSDYQLKKLIKQSRLTGKIESLRKEMNQRVSGDITYALGDDYYGEVVEAQRVVSEDAAHYILIKGLTRKQQIAEAERCKARRLLKEKKESERNPEDKKVSFEIPEEEIPDEELAASIDEWEKTVGAEGEKTDTQPGTARITVSDDDTSDEDKGKSRRERRGKALVTRNGLRSVAKKGKGKKTPAKRAIISDDEEVEDILDVSEETKISSEQLSIKKEPREEPDTVNVEPISEKNSNNNTSVQIKTKEETCLQETQSGLKTEKSGSSASPENGDQHAEDKRRRVSGENRTFDEVKEDFSEKESDFAETRNRLLTEEEDLLKAKEEKMAALMKSLEKRAQVTASPLAQKKPSSEALPSPEVTREKLKQQEEALIKEKEAKMAALLKSVEKRSQLQSNSNPVTAISDERANPESEIDVDSGEKNSEDETCEPEKKPTSRGFLEDVVELEERKVRKKSKRQQQKMASSSTQPTSSAASVSSRSAAFPTLTADYLEDVESMLEPDLSVTGNSSNSQLREKDLKNSAKSSRATDVSRESTKKLKTDELVSTKLFSHTTVTEKGESCDNNEGIFVSAERVSAEQSANSQRRSKRKTTEKMEEVVRKKAKTVPPPVRAAQNVDDSEDEGFIEITIDPSKAPDDLFPASMFATRQEAAVNLEQPSLNQHPSPVEVTGSSDENDIAENDKDDTDDNQSDDDDDKMERRFVEINQQVSTNADPEFGKADKLVHEETMDKSKTSQVKGSVSFVRRDSLNSNVSVPSLEESSEADTEHDVSVESARDEDIHNFAKGVNSLTDLYDLQRGLTAERQALASEMGKQARLGRSITEQTNLEAQELLQLFGVPYVVSPMEAESQCVQLELLGLTQGTITDDSDSWLFGATNVYKNFFNQSKYVEYYSANAIHQRFSLDRRKLINIALLCGSDYTPGIPGVGPVRAMEVLAEFPGEGLEGLRAFRDWWEDAKDGILPRNQGKVKNKLRNLELHEGFPSRQVVEAYLHPAVDDSEEGFTWGMPDLELLRQFAKKKFGWARQKADEALDPMMKELTKTMGQGRIHSYFQPENFLRPKPVQSKRLQAALDKFQNKDISGSESESESESTSQSESEDSDPPLPELGESAIDKANQILSGSTGGRGRGSRGRRGGKRGGHSANQEVRGQDGKGRRGQQEEQQREAMNQPRRGRGRGGKSGSSVERKIGDVTRKPDPQKSTVRPQRTRGRGLGVATAPTLAPKPTLPRKTLLKDEVSLSESSSSSDEDAGEPYPKKQKLHQAKAASVSQHGMQAAKPVVAKQQGLNKGTKKKPGRPNVKKLAPTRSKPAPTKGKAKGETLSQSKSSAEDLAALKEALGGDLDPTTMTLDDLGSDFSDD